MHTRGTLEKQRLLKQRQSLQTNKKTRKHRKRRPVREKRQTSSTVSTRAPRKERHAKMLFTVTVLRHYRAVQLTVAIFTLLLSSCFTQEEGHSTNEPKDCDGAHFDVQGEEFSRQKVQDPIIGKNLCPGEEENVNKGIALCTSSQSTFEVGESVSEVLRSAMDMCGQERHSECYHLFCAARGIMGPATMVHGIPVRPVSTRLCFYSPVPYLSLTHAHTLCLSSLSPSHEHQCISKPACK